MPFFTFNEMSLGRLICDARYKLEVSDGQSRYLVPLKSFIPKSGRHFIAKANSAGCDVVLNYNSIKKVYIDFRVLNCY